MHNQVNVTNQYPVIEQVTDRKLGSSVTLCPGDISPGQIKHITNSQYGVSVCVMCAVGLQLVPKKVQTRFYSYNSSTQNP